MPIGRRLGLIDDERWRAFEAWQGELAAALDRAERASVLGTDAVNAVLTAHASAPLVARRATCSRSCCGVPSPTGAYRRQAVAAAGGVAPGGGQRCGARARRDRGFVRGLPAPPGGRRRQARARRQRAHPRPDRLSRPIRWIVACEAVEESSRPVRPRSIGQASRISGVTPAAIAILLTQDLRLYQRKQAEVGSPPHEA